MRSLWVILGRARAVAVASARLTERPVLETGATVAVLTGPGGGIAGASGFALPIEVLPLRL